MTPLARALVREWIARRGGEQMGATDVALILAASQDAVDEAMRAIRAAYGDRSLSSSPALHLNSALRFAAQSLESHHG